MQQYIQLGHHPRWKKLKRVMLRNPNNLNYMTVKSYGMINLFNGIGKV